MNSGQTSPSKASQDAVCEGQGCCSSLNLFSSFSSNSILELISGEKKKVTIHFPVAFCQDKRNELNYKCSSLLFRLYNPLFCSDYETNSPAGRGTVWDSLIIFSFWKAVFSPCLFLIWCVKLVLISLEKELELHLKKKKKVKLFFNLVLFMNLMQNSAVSGYWLYCFLQTGING